MDIYIPLKLSNGLMLLLNKQRVYYYLGKWNCSIAEESENRETYSPVIHCNILEEKITYTYIHI